MPIERLDILADGPDKHSSEEWCELLDIQVMDPDGWDRSGDFNLDWTRPLTEAEFRNKLIGSTVLPGPTFKWRDPRTM